MNKHASNKHVRMCRKQARNEEGNSLKCDADELESLILLKIECLFGA